MSEYGPGNITALFGGQPFDPNAHEPSKDFEVLPPDKYTCLIESAELKPTHRRDGQYIKVSLSVVEGSHKKRKLFDNINIQNPNEDCQRMGIAQLSALGRAAQCYPVDDTADLINKVVVAVVKVKKRKDTGADVNDIRTYEHPTASVNTQQAVGRGIRSQSQAAPVATAPATQPAGASPATPVAVPAAAGAPGNAPWK